ncbi:hypothetical protein ACHAWF_015398 [Thalassiosira exigua]
MLKSGTILGRGSHIIFPPFPSKGPRAIQQKFREYSLREAMDEDGGDRKQISSGASPEVINGTSDGMIITKLYEVPFGGFPGANGEGTFSTDDVLRLRLDSRNVTLPAALMLLDPDAYPTQSRARKVIRQRSICICRNKNNSNASLQFNELGKVISRIYPGDIIGFQRRVGDDYYAIQGVPYRTPPFKLEVVYEDEHMAIVNKPAGVVVYRLEGGRGSGARGGGHGRDTLLSALPYVLKPSNLTGRIHNDDAHYQPLRRPQHVHRLDRPTSGLVVVAKTREASIHLAQQFEFRSVDKTYMAILNGNPLESLPPGKPESPSEWNTIDFDLEGKSAITKWRAIRSMKSLHAKDGQVTLVELMPKTGRYHQLRRHMAWVLGTPLVGDTTYDGGDDSARRLRKRGLFLCSNEICLEHPYYNTPIGRKEWLDSGGRDRVGDQSLVLEDKNTDSVKVQAQIELPDKFESFLRHENARAIKFIDDE